MSFDWKFRKNNIGDHEHVASQILDEDTGEPTEPSEGGGTDLSPLTWDGVSKLVQAVGVDASLNLKAGTSAPNDPNPASLTLTGGNGAASLSGADADGATGPYGALISAFPGNPNGSGGDVQAIASDAGSGSDADGGDIELAAGSGDATGDGGRITLNGGLSPEGGVGSAGTFQGGFSSGAGGFIELVSGNGGPGTDANGGDITLTAGNGDGSGDGGSVDLSGGDSAGGGTAGGIFLQGSPGNLNGGDVTINGGAGGDNDALGGDVYIQGGAGSGSGRAGLVILGNLPTANPSVAGALWNDGGTLKVSAG